jgi:N-acetyl-gamma-glutamyl-phosphate reductase
MKTVAIIGARGVVSTMLQAKLADDPEIVVAVVETSLFMLAPNPRMALAGADLVVVCTEEALSREVVAKIDPDMAILDISPAFRCDSEWVYGMSTLMGTNQLINGAKRVANPGCMATAAILILQPLVEEELVGTFDPLYLDAMIGYSAGGRKMIAKYQAGVAMKKPPFEIMTSLVEAHPHVGEIKHVTGLRGDVVLAPKIGTYFSGIRMSIMVPRTYAPFLLGMYNFAYAGTDIVVENDNPKKICADEMEGKPGAIIRVYQHGESCLVVCTMDNLFKGAVDTAYENIGLMLGM